MALVKPTALQWKNRDPVDNLPNTPRRLNKIKPAHPQTNGMVERCNGRIEEIPRQTRFASANELATTIEHCAKLADARTPQTMSGHRTPLDTLRAWRKGSDLFVQNIYNLAESDT